MTTTLFGIKDTKSNLLLTKAKVFSTIILLLIIFGNNFFYICFNYYLFFLFRIKVYK